jgi:hypothetical protein
MSFGRPQPCLTYNFVLLSKTEILCATIDKIYDKFSAYFNLFYQNHFKQLVKLKFKFSNTLRGMLARTSRPEIWQIRWDQFFRVPLAKIGC